MIWPDKLVSNRLSLFVDHYLQRCAIITASLPPAVLETLQSFNGLPEVTLKEYSTSPA
jgi:hypothetical protein